MHNSAIQLIYNKLTSYSAIYDSSFIAVEINKKRRWLFMKNVFIEFYKEHPF